MSKTSGAANTTATVGSGIGAAIGTVLVYFLLPSDTDPTIAAGMGGAFGVIAAFGMRYLPKP